MNRFTLEFLDDELERDFLKHVFHTTSNIYKVSQIVCIPTFILFGVYYCSQESYIGFAFSLMFAFSLGFLAYIAGKGKYFQGLVLLQLICYIPWPMMTFYVQIDFSDLNNFYCGHCATYFYVSLAHGCKSKYKFIVGVLQLSANLALEVNLNGYTHIKLIVSTLYFVNIFQQYFIDKQFRESFLLMKKEQVWMQTIEQLTDIMIIKGFIERIDNTFVFQMSNQKAKKELNIESQSQYELFSKDFIIKSKNRSESYSKGQNLEQSLFLHFHCSSHLPYEVQGIIKDQILQLKMLQYIENDKQIAVMLIKRKDSRAEQSDIDQYQLYKSDLIKLHIQKILVQTVQAMRTLQKANYNLQHKVSSKQISIVKMKLLTIVIRLVNLQYFDCSKYRIQISTFYLDDLLQIINNNIKPLFEQYNLSLIFDFKPSLSVKTSHNTLFLIIFNVLIYLLSRLNDSSQQDQKQIKIQYYQILDQKLGIKQIMIEIHQNITNCMTFLPRRLKEFQKSAKVANQDAEMSLSVARFLVGKIGPFEKIYVENQQENTVLKFFVYSDLIMSKLRNLII